MKVEAVPRVGVIDALGSGLVIAARKPILLLIPVLMDLGLWLAPQVSIAVFLERARVAWEALFTAFYTPSQQASMTDMVELMRTAAEELGRQTDLASSLASSWLAPASAVVDVQATRLKLISDGVLAPVGFGLNLPQMAPPPWQPAAIEIQSFWAAALVVAALWALGILLTTVYVHGAATVMANGDRSERARALARPRIIPSSAANEAQAANGQRVSDAASGQGRVAAFRPTLLRFAALSLLLGLIVYLLRVPLAIATALALLSGGSLAAGLFVLSGGITLWFMLWFLSSVFFTSEAILFDGQGLGRALWQGLLMVRASGWRSFGLVVVINLLALGFRAVWGIMGQSALGALLAIVANAYLVTGLLLAVFIFYGGLRREWQALRRAQRVGK